MKLLTRRRPRYLAVAAALALIVVFHGASYSAMPAALSAVWRARVSDSPGSILVDWQVWHPSLAPDVVRVCMVDVATGVRRTIIRSNSWDYNEAVWSPDGKWIADTERGVLILFGGGARGMRWLGAGGYGVPVWSPNSRSLVLTEASGHRLVVREIDGGARVIHRTDGGSVMFNLSWSPDGRWITYDADATGYGHPSLHLIHPDGSSAHTVLETKDGRGIDVPTPAVWSPDGRRFAFSTGKESPDDPGLAVADADSGEVVPLPAAGFPLGWSPDGSELAFVQVGFNTRDVLSLIDASGTIRSFDTTLPEISGGTWSPDGTKLVVATGQASSLRGARSLELVDPAGGRPRVLTHFPGGSSVTVLAWRPSTPAH